MHPVKLTMVIALSLLLPLFGDEGKAPLLEFSTYTIGREVPYRLLAGKDPQGLSLEMDDGSIWRVVDKQSANSVTLWQLGDPLVIHPTLIPTWSGGRFFVVNKRLSSSAAVEISYGPILNTATHVRITYIDPYSGLLHVQDGAGRTSFFRLSSGDHSTFQYWLPNETIIIGSNEDCYSGWFSRHTLILINVEKNTFVHADKEPL